MAARRARDAAAAIAAGLLDRSLDEEKGIGPARAARLAALGLRTARDLLLHFPRGYREWGERRSIASIVAGEEAHVVGRVVSSRQLGWRRGRRAAEVVIEDDSARVACVWFGVAWLADSIQKGSWLRASGRVIRRRDALQISHPEFDLSPEPFAADAPLGPRPVHRTTTGVSERALRRLLSAVLDRLADSEFSEPLGGLPPKCLPLPRALAAIHSPASLEEAEAARRRLAFDELLLLQARFGDAAREAPLPPRSSSYPPAPSSGSRRGRRLADEYVASLPFTLTAGQRAALDALLGDLASERAMNRLLMGDVGCGKTAVFVAALLRVVSAGAQGALLAPTELLARQHATRIEREVAALRVRTALLLGSTPAAERRRILDGLAGGEIDLLIGTHALVGRGVRFRRLGLGVIDEQQRFGVAQRARLRNKSRTAREPSAPNLLVVSATPIPRTLAMALYGDLETTTIRDRPEGRIPIETRAYGDDKRREGYRFLRDLLGQGKQAYLVFPLIDDGDDDAIVSVTRAYDKLRAGYFRATPMAIVHGAMRETERERAMAAFLAGDVRLLLGTSVVEVGIDNPEAVAIGIEHAERFGLAALHQLRGRVGRGTEPSHCLLFPRGALSAKARGRIEAMLACCDGFEIAERDLALRGPGETAGVRQSGFLDMKLADLARDEELLDHAQQTMGALHASASAGDVEASARLARLDAWWGDRGAERARPPASYEGVA